MSILSAIMCIVGVVIVVVFVLFLLLPHVVLAKVESVLQDTFPSWVSYEELCTRSKSIPPHRVLDAVVNLQLSGILDCELADNVTEQVLEGGVTELRKEIGEGVVCTRRYILEDTSDMDLAIAKVITFPTFYKFRLRYSGRGKKANRNRFSKRWDWLTPVPAPAAT